MLTESIQKGIYREKIITKKPNKNKRASVSRGKV